MSNATCLKHNFLLAMPGQAGSYFGNSIIYLCEHNDEGAMGIIVNKPMDLLLGDLLQQLGFESKVESDSEVLEGGPVQTERGFILHSDDKRFDASLELGEGLVLTTARDVLESIGRAEGPNDYLVALGYAGWADGQLEAEIAENAWLTCPASTDILFHTPCSQKVDQAARSLGIDFRLISSQAGYA